MAERRETFMNSTDAFLWWVEADPLLRFTIVAVALLDHAPDFGEVMARFDRASKLAPHLRDKVAEPAVRLSTPRWVHDPLFDLEYHVRRIAAPAPHTIQTAFDYACTSAMAGLDRDRPLWEATLMEGLEGGQAALILKLHHALTDGIGGMQLAMYLFDTEPDAPLPSDHPAVDDPEHLGELDLLREAIGHDVELVLDVARRAARSAVPALANAVLHPATTVTGILRTAASIGRAVAPVTDTMSPVMVERGFSWQFKALEFPLADLRDGAKAVGGTLNDAFLGGITGGLRRYHEVHGKQVDQLRLTLPISIRTPDDGPGGNKAVILRFPVPIGVVDPAERMRQLHDIVQAQRNEPAVPHTNEIAAALNTLPTSVIGSMLKHVDFLASNVPGLRVPVYLAGAEVLRTFPFGPTIGGATNITLMSYRDTCCLGVTTDTVAIPDAGLFHACLLDGFGEIVALGRRGS